MHRKESRCGSLIQTENIIYAVFTIAETGKNCQLRKKCSNIRDLICRILLHGGEWEKSGS